MVAAVNEWRSECHAEPGFDVGSCISVTETLLLFHFVVTRRELIYGSGM